MSVHSLALSEQGYSNLWDKATVRTNRANAVISIAHRIVALKTIFQSIEKATGVPWQWVGAVLYRESDLNLHGAFSSGDLIIGTGRKTYNIPKGRGPFATFAESAIDEIRRRNLHLIKIWSVERMLFEAEAYNGWGYLGKCNSPYVWSYTIWYGPPEAKGGKYIRDRVFSYAANDNQCGVAAIWEEMATIDPDTSRLLQSRERMPPPGVVPEATKKANAGKRKVIQGAGTAAGTGAASEGHKTATGTQTPFLETPVAITLIAIGLTIAIVAVALSIRTGNLLKARW